RVAGQHLRAGGGGQVASDEHVLVRDRHAEQRAALAAGTAGVGGGGLRQRDVGGGAEESAQVGLGFDAVEQVARGLHARHLAGFQQTAERGDAEGVQVGGGAAHSI